MIRLNGVALSLVRSERMPAREQVIAIPEDTRRRLNVGIGDHIAISGRNYEVQRAFIDEVRAAESAGLSQASVVFMRTIPRTLSVDLSLPLGRTPQRTPAPRANTMANQAPEVVPDPEPETREPLAPAVAVQPLPRLEINGISLIPCVGHHMGTNERNTIRIPSAARAVLGLNRGDVVAIGGQNYTVHSALNTDIANYPDLAQSEIVFFHSTFPHVTLYSGTDQPVRMAATATAAQPTAPPAPPRVLTSDEVDREIRGRILTALGEPVNDPNGVMTDLEIQAEIQDGNVNLIINYLPGASATSGNPDNLDAALTAAAEELAAQIRQLIARSQRLARALGNL